MSRKPTVIIYCDRLLPFSATFVHSQAEALQSFIPYYVGSRLIQDLPLPQERTLVVNKGGLLGIMREVSSQLWGVSPAFVAQVQHLNPLLIHAHFGPDGTAALPIAQNLQIPLLVTFHGYDATVTDEHARRSFYKHRVYLRRKEILKREAAGFIAVSEHIKGKLLEQGFPADKVFVHYIGVNTQTFQPDPTVLRTPVVLFVGRLVEKKGCEYLIRAMAQVQPVLPDIELVIIGDGPLRLDLEGLAARKLSRYRFLGVQPSHIVRSWMNQALLLVAPSVTASTGDSEGIPITLLEAQAMGLPVISSIHGGIPDAVVHQETGLLVNERDWKTLAENILLLLKDEALWQQFSQKSKERVQTLFNLQKQNSLLEEIYKQILGQKWSS
ncbi:MAG: D-inositol-3-phosphate glycosyltransferase [Chroococcidiopsis cubana SAG 39.79]|uniref:Glycosyl transferase family 1 n=1 Tax=Chroococcidiopsis cubana SAG 39.79 TaxID=388085 RepID=A0AB37UBB4_9CYAN|nr:glycosyltransferase [Chroococcidiopsis cubana]MDZ4871525.1 D-inositol-3-phosphate glycosyltransferase [Chroococcidiopsis cubana SAG 39.79]PSB64738.1 glycosyl transferase [Chroococcidiopsis cubana CCALA 043]RUT04171.1 glycosyl transferase family 1 [Chroococcidiopsis cubana SAG 39.79]